MTPDQLRVSDHDRASTAELLATHCANGVLTVPELDDRIATVWSARTRADLAAVTADLPAVLRPRGPDVGLRVHVVAYVAVVVGLWLVWLVTWTGHPWPLYPMLGWGSGVVSHAAAVRGCTTTS